ncbi:hypothetical protein C2857_002651 [Epichloe festucae Fl1]|uniref:Uncharacterized protein n=1 Tax=Epichloe festucae (strain Fl1) TaxID=877507 RepID=A0A7U3Q1T4_EPIFF|nr:hypothetical protein C2857_002651 [Epichloe festucae Fl1]
MVFRKEDNRELLQSLKNLVRRDREAGEYVPPNFDSILQSLDQMSAKNDGSVSKTSNVHASTTYGPGRKEYEVLQAYNSLIEAGGRPVCRLGDTSHISKDPVRYLEMLVPWIGASSSSDSGLDWKSIFQQQLFNWQQFRAWQKAHRDVPAVSGAASTTKEGSVTGNIQRANSSVDGSSSKFEIHVESTRQRLTHCGFTKSFCFNNDTHGQDDWTTWIEYLSFEYSCFDDCSRHLKAEELGNLGATMMLNCPDSAAQSNHGRSRAQPTHTGLKHSSAPRTGHENGLGAPRPHGGQRLNGNVGVTAEMDNSRTSENTNNARSDHDGTVSRVAKLNDAEHHNLILKWALLQEPEIAAMRVHQPRVIGSDLRRLKRHRDGSLCGSGMTLSHIDRGDDPNDELETKRCRGSG